MERRAAWAVTAAVVVGLLAALAATSGPVRLWSVDPTTPTVPTITTVAPTDVADPVGPDPWAPPIRDAGDNVFMQILGVIVGVLALLAMARALRAWKGFRLPQLRWRRRPERDLGVPAVDDAELAVNAVAARAALRTGTPRNAIVACWMQLERDAAEAGLPRLEAETSAEYAQRVVARASVDPAPIAELAARYREARFSRHDLTDAHRDRAADALDRVLDALARGVRVDA